MKKIIAMLLALMMLLSLSATAFAAEDTSHTITVDNGTSGFTYKAYQIFKGTVDETTKQLTDIQWGKSIKDPAALIAALQTIEEFKDCTNAVEVAAALNGKRDDDDLAKAFAAVVGDATFADGAYTYTHLKDDTAGTSTYSEANKVYTIPVIGDGYYLVLNSAVPDYEQEPDGDPTESEPAYTRYILTVVEDVEVKHKGNVPTLVKKIIEDGNEVSANTAEIGEVINYKITATMPSNIADYKSYYFKFNDYLSEGLTYQDDIQITVNGKTVTIYKNATAPYEDDGFHVQETPNTEKGGNNLTAAIADLKALKTVVGDITSTTEVVITYTAVLNEKAEVGDSGNPNLVNLVYSNDPNYTGEPNDNPFVPTPNSPVGETPYDRVITYTTEIQVKKIDATTKEALTGAKFSISGFSTNVKVINEEMFIPYAANQDPEEGNVWYRLKDGTYTQTAPVSNDDNPDDNVDPVTAQHYDDPTKTYKKVTTLVDQTFTEEFTAEGWVDEDGIITFTGLGAGTYTIKEIVAPNGYNLLEDEIIVVITSDVDKLTDPAADTKVTWTAKLGEDNTAELAEITEDGIITFEVENQSGSTLPSTGGIGTTVFYILGGALVLAAVVMLITKKRMTFVD